MYGEPQQPGRFPIEVQVADDEAGTADRTFAIVIVADLAVQECPRAVTTTGVPYTAGVAATGGESPYSWAVTEGALPTGLQLGENGQITGTPTEPGNQSFTLRVTDRTGAAVSRSCSVNVAPPVAVSIAGTASAVIDQTYSLALSVSGGTQPYTWSIASGQLPSGLSLDRTSGKIGGKPSVTGTFSVTIRVVDSIGAVAEKQLSITVGGNLAVSSCPAEIGTIGQPYQSTLAAAGGLAPYRWTVTEGALPAGLSLDGTTIQGEPAEPGIFELDVALSDSAGASTTRNCSISISPPLGIPARSVPIAIVGNRYAFELTAQGGNPPYSWSLADGGLAEGLRLNPTGLIDGIAGAAGNYAFTAVLADKDQRSMSRRFTLTVAPGQLPAVKAEGLAEIIGPAEQPRINLTLAAAYPTAISGVLSLRFTPDPGLTADDPAIQFSSGGRSIHFTIPENGTRAVFAGGFAALQTGTVAGTITLTADLGLDGSDTAMSTQLLSTLRVDRVAPRITAVRLNSTATGFDVTITGYATTREVQGAVFRFKASSGTTLETQELTVDLRESSRRWYDDPASARFGSQFTLVQPFLFQGAGSGIASVTLTLSNSQGASMPAETSR